MAHIIPLARAGGQEAPPDVSAVAFALTHIPLDWWSPMLPGETLDEARARRAAAADIFDDLLAEYAAAEGVAA